MEKWVAWKPRELLVLYLAPKNEKLLLAVRNIHSALVLKSEQKIGQDSNGPEAHKEPRPL